MTDTAVAAPAAGATAANGQTAKAAAPDVKGAQTSPEANKQAAATARKLKLRIDNQEVELDEEEVIRRAQRATRADKDMQTGAQQRKQAEELTRLLKTAPLKLLEQGGHDVKKLVNDYLKAQLEETSLTPEQKRLRDLEKQIKDREDEDNRKKKEASDREKEAAANKWADEMDVQIGEILQTSGLPKTMKTVQRIIHFMQLAVQQGRKNVSPKSVIGAVKQEYVLAQNDLYGSADDDSLLSLLGDELTAKIVKAHLAKMNKKGSDKGAALDKPVVVQNPKDKPKRKQMSEKEWLKNI